MPDVGWWCVGKPIVNFLFALIELFCTIYSGSGVMRWNVYSSAVFTGGSISLHSILPEQGCSPSTILGVRKETLSWRPHPSAFPHFDTIPECDGQTVRQTVCCSIYSACIAVINTKTFCRTEIISRCPDVTFTQSTVSTAVLVSSSLHSFNKINDSCQV